MTTVELDMRRMELIRDIMDTDSIEVLDKVKRAFKRAVKSVQTDTYGPVPGIPHTIEEVKADIAEFVARQKRITLGDKHFYIAAK